MTSRARRRERRRRGDRHRTGSSAPTRFAPPHADRLSNDAPLLIVIMLCAFAVRLIYIMELRNSPTFEHPIMDELYYDEWAQAIAEGETFIEGPYYRAPLYAAFLGAVYKVFGHSYLAPRVIQAVIGSLSCGLLFLIGRSVFGRAIGGVAGFVAAGYWMLIYFDGELLVPSLIVFLDLLLVYLLLRSARAAGKGQVGCTKIRPTTFPAKRAYAFVGVVLGLSAVARPNVLLFAPAIVIWLAFTHRAQPRRALAYVTLVAAGCLLVILPITVRNYVVGKDIVLISSQGGVNFYIGNNPQANGRTVILPGTPGDLWGTYYASIERAEQALGGSLKPSEVSRYYLSEALDFIRRQPGKFVALACLKISLFWSWGEISNNKDIYFWSEHFTPLVKWLPVGFRVVGPLGILGLVLCRRRRVELFPLWGFVLVYMVSMLLFFCTARFRMPILPPLILLAVYATFQGVSAVRQARWRDVVGMLAVLVPAALFVSVTRGAGTFRNDANSYVILGNVYHQQGELDLAAANYRKALEITPGYLTPHYRLGMILAKAERLPEAIAELRLALAARPVMALGETIATVASVQYNLANTLVSSGAYIEAIEHYQACIKLDPSGMGGRAPFNLGLLLTRLGRNPEAIDPFAQAVGLLRDALRTDPDDPELLYALGQALFTQGKYEEAVAPLRRCLRVEPGKLAHLVTLAAALAETGHFEEAADLSRRALQRARRSPLAPDRDLIDPITESLKLYESGQRYRLTQP